MANFYPLSVVDVRRETRNSVVLTLEPRDEDRDTFAFIHGQYLTFRRDFDGEELRRSYSICAAPCEGTLRVGIKKVDGGFFSTWANDQLQVGQVLESMAPLGNFHSALEPDRPKSYLAFAVGSGITPVLSIIKTVLAQEPRADLTLVYGNRSTNSIMFREELEDLKNRYLGRFTLVHVLAGESQDIDLFSGRIDADKCEALFQSWISPEKCDQAYICGPESMMLATAASLRAHGMGDEQIKFELFATARRSQARRRETPKATDSKEKACSATITLDGTSRVVEVPKQGLSLLDAALEADLDVPYACKVGVCSTCRAMVLEGEVEMKSNHALDDYEVRSGYVLTCQASPLTDKLVVDYDQ
jgi:ring-1,2-phenylacetyl-CoA epoxidase subunit PaaE